MVTAEGVFPKVGNDPVYNSEVNGFHNYPKELLYSTSTSTTFTPTKSDSRIIVWVKGQWNAGATSAAVVSTTIDLDIATVTKDTTQINDTVEGGAVSSNEIYPFSLMWSDTSLSAASTAIALTTSSGSLLNVKIIIMEYIV